MIGPAIDRSDATGRLIVNINGAVVAAMMIGMLWFLLVELFSVPVPSANHDVLLVVIGVLLREVGNIVSFYFTGDATTRRQADTIASLAKGAVSAAPANASVTIEAPQPPQ